MKAQNLIPHTDLDRRLDALADDPDRFLERADGLARELNAAGTLLEISDPMDWRSDAPERRTSFVNQFEADVDAILHLDREEEATLARRIEFARLLVDDARRRAGLEPKEAGAEPESTAKLPPEVARRENELHALRTEMVERNLYLVLANVDRYAHSSTSRWDLIQEGCAALFRAVDGFDWRRGLLFRTYAVHWLNQAFRNFLYNFGHTVRVPVYLQKALKHINQAQIRLGDPKATIAEIADTADMSEKLVSSALSAARRSHSIDIGLGDEGDGNRLRDILAEEDDDGPYSPGIEDVSLESGLARAMGALSKRERLVVQLRFGIGVEREHTLAEVAERLGVSVERVRQIQVRAVAKMDTPSLRRDLDPYLN
jgi:RNA polymerase primary sigma factor